jgi:hypothetical protein
MSDENPEPGTIRYLCPLECGWHHDEAPPSLADIDGVAPDPQARIFRDIFSSIVTKASMRRAERTETALREHLDTHTTLEFATVIHGLRVEVARLKSSEGAPSE